MENVPLALGVSYKKLGNDSGMQIDTLSMALIGSTYDTLCLDSHEYFDEFEQGAIKGFDFEEEFLACLSKEEAERYLDKDAYDAALAAFKDNLIEQAREFALPDTHPLAIAIESARGTAEDILRREWLHGDRYALGLLKDAGRYYGVEFSYDERADLLGFDVGEDTLEDWREREDIAATEDAASAFLAHEIDAKAAANHERNQKVMSESRAANQERVARLLAGKKEAEEERVRRLKAI